MFDAKLFDENMNIIEDYPNNFAQLNIPSDGIYEIMFNIYTNYTYRDKIFYIKLKYKGYYSDDYIKIVQPHYGYFAMSAPYGYNGCVITDDTIWCFVIIQRNNKDFNTIISLIPEINNYSSFYSMVTHPEHDDERLENKLSVGTAPTGKDEECLFIFDNMGIIINRFVRYNLYYFNEGTGISYDNGFSILSDI